MERWIVLLVILGLTGWWLYKSTRKYPIHTVWGTVVDVQPSRGTDNFYVLLSKEGGRAIILEFEVLPTAKRCQHKHNEQCFHGRNEELKKLIQVGNTVTVITHDTEEQRTRRVHRLVLTK